MTTTITSLLTTLHALMENIIRLCIGLAVLGFLWGVFRSLVSGESEKVKKEGREFMLYGILALFVMTSLWGLVNLLAEFVVPQTAKTTTVAK